MTYDHWKTRSPDDEYPLLDEPPEGMQMTRDEAMKKAEDCSLRTSTGYAFTPARLVALLEKLGLLNFDEPKNATELLIEACEKEGLDRDTLTRLRYVIAAKGFTIIRSPF